MSQLAPQLTPKTLFPVTTPQTKKPQATNPGASQYAYAWRDSNPQPILSQETALSVELQTYAVRTLESGLITEPRFFSDCV